MRTWCLVDIEMKAYNKPCIFSYNINTNKFIASSQPLETPDIPTIVGGFYECSNRGCRPNSYTYSDWNTDSRNIRLNDNKEEVDWPNGTKYQYIGCYEYKSNGGSVTCEDFHGTNICEGSQWDLFINKNGNYYVRPCPDGVH